MCVRVCVCVCVCVCWMCKEGGYLELAYGSLKRDLLRVERDLFSVLLSVKRDLLSVERDLVIASVWRLRRNFVAFFGESAED